MQEKLSGIDGTHISIAVILPCFNEETSIKEVINSFKDALPQAQIVVCDNASTDKTNDVAKNAGARVIFESRRGKANAVRRLLQSVEADIYVLCDGDMTYDASITPSLIHQMVNQNLAMIIGARVSKKGHKTFRRGHGFGNYVFTTALGLFFGGNLSDVLSGYRVLSRSFVRSFPILSKGFDIEVEMTAHALATGVSISEANIQYFERPVGSYSKLHTFKDGALILATLMRLVIEHQPLKVFLILAIIQFSVSAFLFQPVFSDYLETGLVERFPTAMLSLGLIITGLFTAFSGIILYSFSRQRVEAKKLAFLAMSSPKAKC